MYKHFLKRIIDLIAAVAGLLIVSPILVIVSIGLIIANDGKPFFFQLRPGKHGEIFKIVKFKTMNDKKDKDGNLLPDAQRLTKIGGFVRKISLDELPQLLNVLKGEMSFIGPRPLLEQYLPYYTAREKLRHTVRPGITGWAQVNGRNTINWDKRLEFDAQYVQNLSFRIDLKIFIRTIINVVTRKDIVVIPGELFTTFDNYRKNENKTKSL
jgi:undecaprenyl phosphate N,N'-diacetylbacillosamine 1-phosphate transferase